MNEDPDDELRRLIGDLGADGRRRSPSFQAVWRAASGSRTGLARGSNPGAKRVLAAVVAICLAGLVWILFRPPAPTPVDRRAIAVLGDEDRAMPTDFLLTAGKDYSQARTEQIAEAITTLLER